MSRETAVTEELSYATDHCDICSKEVAVDDVPDDVIEPQGYAVLLGEGAVTRKSEDAGNWDEEVHFELDKEDSDLPAVSAYIVCENCAEAVHDISRETPSYTGTLPTKLAGAINTTNAEVLDWTKILIYAVGVALLFVTLLILL